MENQGEITRVKRVQLWDAGIDLGISWKKFGALRQREQQIQKMGTPHSLMLQELMLGDVFGMITDGELIALGYRIQPSPSDGPIVIPWDIFTVRPEFDDVSNSVVIASGYKYERIKLVEKSHFESLIAEISLSAVSNFTGI